MKLTLDELIVLLVWGVWIAFCLGLLITVWPFSPVLAILASVWMLGFGIKMANS